MMKILSIIFGMLILVSLASASSIVLDSVSQDKLYPGEKAQIVIDLKNTFDQDVKDVSVVLNLEETQFTSSGSVEDSEDRIEEDEEESFSFRLKAPSSLTPGDYNIPYTVTYELSGNTSTKTGIFGITVIARTELDFVIETDTPVVGEQGKVSLKIINKGLGDIGFVTVEFTSANGFEILSPKQEYIGTVRSDDFETATIDVLFKNTGASLSATITYKDLENKEQSETIVLPVGVYSRERALEIGLIQESKTGIYIGIIVVVILIWLIYRKIRKSRRKKKLNKGE